MNLAHDTRKAFSWSYEKDYCEGTPVDSKVLLKTAHLCRIDSPPHALLLSQRYSGVTGTINRLLFIGSNSSPFRKNICLGIESAFAPPAMTGPNGEQFLESERTDADRRFLPHR